MKKILMTLALLSALAQGAWAQQEYVINYIYYTVNDDGETITKNTGSVNTYFPLSYNLIHNSREDNLFEDWYVLNSNLTYPERIVISGNDVHIILCDGCTLTAEQGIRIDPGAKLTIYAQSEVEGTMGKLVAIETHHDKAAIGGNKNYRAGTLIIHGGEIEADASEGKYAAGIGGGYGDGSGMEGITIYGGKVTAKGARYGAGIGGGKNNNNPGTIGIYGGTVEATGGYMGAGIGGGENRAGWTTNIYGGDITATGHVCAAGIGGGDAGAGGVINIKGGTVNATGSETGIGSGSESWGDINGSITQITISGNAKVTATGATGYATGIGSDDCDGHTCTITIEGDAEVEAKGGSFAAGIGASNGDAIGTVIIRGNAKVTATGGGGGPGIGTGADNQKGSLTISGNAVVTAKGIGGGAGIGGILYHPGFPVTIESGATVYAYGSYYFNYDYKTTYTSAAIGGGAEKEDGSSVTIANGAKVYLFTAAKRQNEYGLDRYAIGRSYHSKKTGSLTLGDQLLVKRMNADGSATEFISTDNRIAACQFEECERLEILPCEHSVYDFQIVGGDDGQHYKQCKYCAYKFDTENHSYNTNGYCSYCNYKATEVIKVNLYSGDNSGYTAQTIRMPKGHNFILPSQYLLPEYMVFEGWLKDPATAPTTWEKTAGETLLAPGAEITPDADVNLYARYSYQYGTEWTWAADLKSATLKVINLENNSVAATISNPNIIQIPTEATVEKPGYISATATASYTDSNGRSFEFSDSQSMYTYVTVNLGETNNAQMLNVNTGALVTAKLKDRTLYKDGSWNTLCLPFDASVDEGSPLAGATLKEFTDAAYDAATGTLTLTFSDATGIEAGKPYLIKWDSGTDLTGTDLVFTGVTLNSTMRDDDAMATDDIMISFCGTYDGISFDSADKSILFLGADNTLYYPQNGASIGAQRAYFKLSGLSVGNIANSAIVLNFGDGETTGIGSIDNGGLRIDNDDWYSLDGRKLSGKPSVRGIYINNGKKVVIK